MEFAGRRAVSPSCDWSDRVSGLGIPALHNHHARELHQPPEVVSRTRSENKSTGYIRANLQDLQTNLQDLQTNLQDLQDLFPYPQQAPLRLGGLGKCTSYPEGE